MTRPLRIPLSDLDAAAEASGQPAVWSEAMAIAHEITRRERDLARVGDDVARCPPTACGVALAREWASAARRRSAELLMLRSRLASLRAAAPEVVSSAVASAPAALDQWIVVPGGSEADG